MPRKQSAVESNYLCDTSKKHPLQVRNLKAWSKAGVPLGKVVEPLLGGVLLVEVDHYY